MLSVGINLIGSPIRRISCSLTPHTTCLLTSKQAHVWIIVSSALPSVMGAKKISKLDSSEGRIALLRRPLREPRFENQETAPKSTESSRHEYPQLPNLAVDDRLVRT